MKLFRQILITFFTASMTVVLVYGGYTIYAEGEENHDFRTESEFYDVFYAYHAEMNDYFNTKIEKMVTLIDSPGFYQNPEKKKQFLPPSDLKDNDKIGDILVKCGDSNYSSYCVSIGALKTYQEYLNKLESLKNNINLGGVGGGPVFGTVATEFLRSRFREADEINKESQEARAVMESTVAAYNEFRLAYPMHKKYEEILNMLTKYKLILKDIRLRVAEFPVRFVDSSTSKCE